MKVVLVHGFLDRARIMSGLSRHLSAAGHSCFSPTLAPSDARSGLSILSEQLERFVTSTLSPSDQFALVGYSMGALVCRHYLQERSGHCRVPAFFSIAGPHAGTFAAYLYPGVGAHEMRPRSSFIRQLEQTSDRISGVSITCYWSPVDPVVVPARSARMAGAEHVRLPLAFHPTMTFDRRIYRDIEHRLAKQKPNKAPEPTSSSVMPRAILASSDLKQRTEDQNQARATPAEAVAHL